jgi:hypothetical protein
MRGSVEVKNAPTVMLDDKESIEHTKCQGRNGKEIESRCDLTVVFEERQPTLRLLAIGAPLHPPQIAGDCRFRDIKAELYQFTMDARRAPSRIIGLHALNQLPDFPADFEPPDGVGTEPPEPQCRKRQGNAYWRANIRTENYFTRRFRTAVQ